MSFENRHCVGHKYIYKYQKEVNDLLLMSSRDILAIAFRDTEVAWRKVNPV